MKHTCLALLSTLVVASGATAAAIDAYDDFFDDGVIGAQWSLLGAGAIYDEAVNAGFMTIDIPAQGVSQLLMQGPPVAQFPEYVMEARVLGEVGDAAAGPGTGTKIGSEGFFLSSFGGTHTIARISNGGINGVFMNGTTGGFFSNGGPDAWVQPINWRITQVENAGVYTQTVEWSADPPGVYHLLGVYDVTPMVTDALGYQWSVLTDERDFVVGNPNTVPLTTLVDFIDYTPEPATLSLLLLGTVAVTRRRR
ncbi:MAG: PEP-CTERM sorting domain-containing protein [bacterium]|nr:PEP-CTERM sorting domain-containing protein [bacterium]